MTRLRRLLGKDAIKVRVRVGYVLTMPVEFIESVEQAPQQ